MKTSSDNRNSNGNFRSGNLLLCSFTKKSEFLLADAIVAIKRNFIVPSGKVFVYECEEDKDKLFLVYNIKETKLNFNDVVRGTIRVSRKKESNTIYTISALNKMAELEENPQVNEKGMTKITWNKYNKCLVLVNKNKEDNTSTLKTYHTKIYRIVVL